MILALVVVTNRLLGLVWSRRSSVAWPPPDDTYQPTITVIIPLYNEGAGIAETLLSILAASYPKEKLDIICIDDASNDNSFAHASKLISTAQGRLRVVRNERNLGKRMSLVNGVRTARGEIIVSVDSDVIVDPDAFQQLVRRFVLPQVAAVGGWVDVRNKHTNWLTRMQTIQYWFAYYVMRNNERKHGRMLCLPGCLTAYRRTVLVELEPVLVARRFLGRPVNCGEDRFLARQIVKAGYLTTLTLEARCQTFVPNRMTTFLAQQLRWRRSNLIDYVGALSHVWRLNPLISIHYFSQCVFFFSYPLAVFMLVGTRAFLLVLLAHAILQTAAGFYYGYRVRHWPRTQRVNPFSYTIHAVVMLVSYGLMIPLAMLTILSRNWQTRHVTAAAAIDASKLRA